jgi:hypothetical protein
MTERARCKNCGHEYAQRNLRAAPDGGAICKDWFACQRRCDALSKELGLDRRMAQRRKEARSRERGLRAV